MTIPTTTTSSGPGSSPGSHSVEPAAARHRTAGPRRTAGQHEATAQPAGALTGLWPMIRLALRRDRIWWPAWIIPIAAEVVVIAGAYESLYPTQESRLGLGPTMGTNLSLRAMYGHAFDLTSAGGFTAWRIGAFAAAVIGLMSLLSVIRHTRAEEEAGRLELLRSGVVGRHAPLAAALVVTVAANVVLAGLVVAGLISEQLPVAGALVMALGFLSVGVVFAGIAAVTAQISENARPARAMAGAALGVAYLLRAIGDSASDSSVMHNLSWLSPIGWAQQARPFAGDRWWALAIPLVVGPVLIGLGIALESRRDFASGLRPASLGRPRAADGLASAGALAWRLQRGSLVGWAVAVAIFATALGSVANGVLAMFDDNAQLEELFRRMGGAQSLVDAFFGVVLGVIATVATVQSVQAMLRLRSEETELRAEQVLGTAVTRTRLAASHLVHAVLGPAILMLVAGLCAGAAYASSAGNAQLVWRVVGGALVLVPAIWVLAGLTMALIGLAPRLSSLAWGALALCATLGQIGPLLNLPDVVLRISPFANVPRLPGAELEILPLVVLTALAAALVAAGLRGFRNRDIG